MDQCFVPLLKWILRLGHSEEKWLPLAIDATRIGQNFTVLSLHVLLSWMWNSLAKENR